jgi:tRNA/rRNA methyltransferase
VNLSRVTLVLDKVRHPDNLGSALRAMKNCGLARIVLADPHTRDFERARKMAVDAEDLLDGMRIARDLQEAVASGTLVAGTTSRQIRGRPTVLLRDFVARASAHTDAGGEVAVVFGNEQRGLSDRELDLCHQVVTIPTAPAKLSINLAQSVMLVSYECYQASLAPPAEPEPRPEPQPSGEAATAAALNTLYGRMRDVLLAADFLNRQNPDLILSELKRLLERARPTRREAELLITAFKHLDRAIRRPAGK